MLYYLFIIYIICGEFREIILYEMGFEIKLFIGDNFVNEYVVLNLFVDNSFYWVVIC